MNLRNHKANVVFVHLTPLQKYGGLPFLRNIQEMFQLPMKTQPLQDITRSVKYNSDKRARVLDIPIQREATRQAFHTLTYTDEESFISRLVTHLVIFRNGARIQFTPWAELK